jgi:acetyltransferase-like isoleucine patch superfamily enzyme
MGKILFQAVYSLLGLFRIPALIRKILEEERRQLWFSRVTAEENVVFGPDSMVQAKLGKRANIIIGGNTIIDGELLVHDYGGKITIGNNTYVGKGSRIWSGESVKVGSRVFIAHNVNITDTNSHQISAKERAEDYQRRIVQGKPFEKGSIETASVEIGDDAWINFNVGILKGVKIGEGAIIGAGSMVTKDIPPYTFAAGNPIRIIKEIPRA